MTRNHLTRSTPDTAPRAPDGPASPGVLTSHVIDSAGGKRRYVLYVPRAWERSTPLPLVLNLHGSTSYPEEQLWFSDMAHAADRHGVAVLAPEALDRAWNVPVDSARADDIAFIHDAITDARSKVLLDETRLFGTGFSGGARMLCLLASELPTPFTGIAPVAGIRFVGTCPSERRPMVLAFHGTLDQINPYDGGGFPYWQTGVEDAISRWVVHNGAEGERVARPASTVVHTVYGSGPRRVEHYRIAALGHIWPGFPHPLGPVFDPPSTAIDATEVILTAFATLA